MQAAGALSAEVAQLRGLATKVEAAAAAVAALEQRSAAADVALAAVAAQVASSTKVGLTAWGGGPLFVSLSVSSLFFMRCLSAACCSTVLPAHPLKRVHCVSFHSCVSRRLTPMAM